MINYKIYVWNEKRKRYIQLFKGKNKDDVINKFNFYHKKLVHTINKSWSSVDGINKMAQLKYHQITNEEHKPYLINLSTNEKEEINYDCR